MMIVVVMIAANYQLHCKSGGCGGSIIDKLVPMVVVAVIAMTTMVVVATLVVRLVTTL